MKLAEIYANTDLILVQTQQLHEDAIDAYEKANRVYSEAFIAYRKRKGEEIIKARESYPVTLCLDIVNGIVAEEKLACLVAEGEKKKLEKLIDAYENRLNTIKFIVRGAALQAGDR